MSILGLWSITQYISWDFLYCLEIWSVGLAPSNSPTTHFGHTVPAEAAYFSQTLIPLTSVDQHWMLCGTTWYGTQKL